MARWMAWNPRRRRATRALESARIIDAVVDNQLELVARLSEPGRRRAGDFLAELVMLAAAYRHYAAGWIGRRELEHRGVSVLRRLAEIRSAGPSQAHFTERD
jgi:hypothetical protein